MQHAIILPLADSIQCFRDVEEEKDGCGGQLSVVAVNGLVLSHNSSAQESNTYDTASMYAQCLQERPSESL